MTPAAMYMKTSWISTTSSNRLSHFENCLNLFKSNILHNIFLAVHVEEVGTFSFIVLYFSQGLTGAVVLTSLKLIQTHYYYVHSEIYTVKERTFQNAKLFFFTISKYIIYLDILFETDFFVFALESRPLSLPLKTVLNSSENCRSPEERMKEFIGIVWNAVKCLTLQVR